MIDIDEDDLWTLLHGVSFHNTKAKNIKLAAEEINSKHKGKVPDTMKGLLKLKGVGPKMAILVLKTAFGKVEGISVDTHVHRIANRLEWVEETKTPEQTRK